MIYVVVIGLMLAGIAYEKIAHHEREAAKPTPVSEKVATPRAFR